MEKRIRSLTFFLRCDKENFQGSKLAIFKKRCSFQKPLYILFIVTPELSLKFRMAVMLTALIVLFLVPGADREASDSKG
jgi:hypothetical protein